MFAVVRTGGKQYRVAAGDKIVVEKMDGAAGDTVSLGDVLLAGHGAELRNVEGLLVQAEIIAQAKADKVIVFKKRRRHNYRRKNGHRQQHTILRITAIGDEKAPERPNRAARSEPMAAETPQLATDEAVQDTAPAPKARTKKAPAPEALTEPAAANPKAQAPLKEEGAASEMVDAPAKPKAKPKPKAATDDKKAK